MKYKIIAMDFDGTLLTDNKKVTEKWQSVLGNDIFNILIEFNKIDEENCE